MSVGMWVCGCASVYGCVNKSVCMYVYGYVCVCACFRVRLCVCVRERVCICVRRGGSVGVWICVGACVCARAHVCCVGGCPRHICIHGCSSGLGVCMC